MELLDAVLYFILIIILIALIGILAWLIYDYYNYKDEQEAINSLNINNFEKNSVTDEDLKNEMNVLYLNNSNYIGTTSNYLIDYTNSMGIKNNLYTDSEIYKTSNFLFKNITSNIANTSNSFNKSLMHTSNLLYNDVYNTSNVLYRNTANINDNLNRYFEFKSFPSNKKIFDMITDTELINTTNNLNLKNNTFKQKIMRRLVLLYSDKLFIFEFQYN